jgi:DNA-binding winged helix-turn-helix (wHTH) protein
VKKSLPKTSTNARLSVHGEPRSTARFVEGELRSPARFKVGLLGETDVTRLLQIAQLRAEKCELLEARETYSCALEFAKAKRDLRSMMEALAGLLRLAGEGVDSEAVAAIERELDGLMRKYPKQVPPMAWYCKGAIARHADDVVLAQKHFHSYLSAVELEREEFQKTEHAQPNEVRQRELDESYARGWVMMAILLWQRNRLGRSLWLAETLLKRFEASNLHGVNGMLYQLLGGIYEKREEYDLALTWFHRAHAAFLGEHSWYYHLYVLYAYARVARKQRNYPQAKWYLDLIEKAVASPEFGLLRRELAYERRRLAEDSVDLTVDLREGTVETRESGVISFGKQYVLLHILEALAAAHRRPGDDSERGLSKAEIIGTVWKASYRPEAHDNKLYYNINRLRKLLEPDAHRPKYLMNWKEGYRLAPGLTVQVIGGAADPLATGGRPGLRSTVAGQLDQSSEDLNGSKASVARLRREG